ncbi:MAG: hypothetical protein ACIARQ_15025, partial [Phycisphaerales bacterium JB061]
MQWIGILLACLAMESALIAATLVAAVIFSAQLATSSRLLAVVGEPKLWRQTDAIHRRPHWYAAFGSAAFGIASIVGAFLLWTLS